MLGYSDSGPTGPRVRFAETASEELARSTAAYADGET